MLVIQSWSFVEGIWATPFINYCFYNTVNTINVASVFLSQHYSSRMLLSVCRSKDHCVLTIKGSLNKIRLRRSLILLLTV